MSHELSIHNARIITPTHTIDKGWLYCRDGIIESFGKGEGRVASHFFDAKGLTLLPAFVDIHVHGAMDADVMDTQHIDSAHLMTMGRFFAQHGVANFTPTTLTASFEDLIVALSAVQSMVNREYEGARIVGAHLEGPYFNPAKCGAQDVQHIRRADQAEATALLKTGVLRLLALAPEYEENLWLIEACQRYGVTVSAGHTNATYEQMRHAIELGITHSTHTYNAQPSLNHRTPGGMAALLLSNAVRCELIADNVHVHPAMMNMLYHLKGKERLVLISDSMRACGMPAGTYTLGAHQVFVADGKATLADGTLAGSILTMDVALRNLCEATGESIETLWRTASLNPAQAIHIAHETGSIERGKRADLILVDEQVNVYTTLVGGQVVFSR